MFFFFVCFITLSLSFPSKIITDGRDINAVDNDGCRLPTMVYMSREKRPQQLHNFKAGALNALVSFTFLTSNCIADTNFNLYYLSIAFKLFHNCLFNLKFVSIMETEER